MADGHIPKGARKKKVNRLETQSESIRSQMEAAASYESRRQIYEQAHDRHSRLVSNMETLLGGDNKTAALLFEESQRAINDMYELIDSDWFSSRLTFLFLAPLGM
jgi:hypothetical protein